MTKKLSILICSFLFFTAQIFAQRVTVETPVQNTRLTVNASSTVQLKGPWHFYWGKFLSYDEIKHTEPDAIVKLPSTWNSYDTLSDEAKKIARTGKGSGTYHLVATNLEPDTLYAFRTYDLASTAIKIIVNGTVVFQAGTPAENWKDTKIDQKMDLVKFKTADNGKADILMYVSNNVFRNGGMWKTLDIGKADIQSINYMETISLYSILSGILFAVMLYGAFVFLTKKDKASLFLALFAFSVLIRLISSDFPILKQIFTGIPYAIMIRLEYTALFLSPTAYSAYLRYLDKNIYNKVKIRYALIVGMIFGVIVYFTPLAFSNHFVLPMQIYLGIVMLMDIICLTIYLFKYKNFIGVFSIVTVVTIMIAAFNDILIPRNHGFRIFGSEFVPFSFVIFSICQTIILAVTQVKYERQVRHLYNFLSKTNAAYNRFVPKQFLELFNYKDISEIEIGDRITTNMTFLAADIRNFTAISENLSEMEVFDLLNGYLEQISPIIYKHGGIIEKFLGDGIIVLFRKNYAEALSCAIEMQEKMIEVRRQFAQKGLPEIKIGIGVHYGSILIGTAGVSARMSEIAISTELAVLQHVESATKRYDKSIIATREAIAAAANELRRKGQKFDFSGKKIPEAIGHELYHIYNDKIEKHL